MAALGARTARATLIRPMQAHRRALVSEAEFLALPESTQRVELLDGILGTDQQPLKPWTGGPPAALSPHPRFAKG